MLGLRIDALDAVGSSLGVHKNLHPKPVAYHIDGVDDFSRYHRFSQILSSSHFNAYKDQADKHDPNWGNTGWFQGSNEKLDGTLQDRGIK